MRLSRVVVSDRVGARFDLVVPDENGCVFPAGDVESLAEMLRRILPDPAKEGAHGLGGATAYGIMVATRVRR